MGRLLKTKIPAVTTPATGKIHKEAHAQDKMTRANRKLQRDRKRRGTTKTITPGDRILIKQQKTSTKPPFDPQPYTVTKVKGTQITASRGDQVKVRNAAKCKLLQARPKHLTTQHSTGSTNLPDNDSEDEDLFTKVTSVLPPTQNATSNVEQPTVQPADIPATHMNNDYRRFSTRAKKPPARYTP